MDHFQHFDPTTAYTLRLREASQLRESAERLIREGASMFEEAQARTAGRRYSITRAINAVITHSRQEGPEADFSMRAAAALGVPYSIERPHIPWSALSSRALAATGTTAGLELVGAPVSQAVGVLRPYSTLIRLGATVVDGLVGNVSLPRITTGVNTQWLAETGTSTASDVAFDQVSASPKKLSTYVELSRQLLKQSPEVADRAIAENLLSAAGAAIDTAMLSGTGGDSPTGIVGVSGVSLVDATSFNVTAAHGMVADVAASNVNDANIKFLSTPAARELLALRPVELGTGTSLDAPVWRDDMLAGKSAYVSANVPSAQVYCGDFSQAWLCLWGLGAMQVQINPFTNWKADIIGAKVVVHCDLAVLRPAAFAVGTGIT